MLGNSKLLLKLKLTADLLALTATIIIDSTFFVEDFTGLFTNMNLLRLMLCLISWIICARAAGAYSDFREKPFSIEWVAFVKAQILYVLLISFLLLHLEEPLFQKHYLLLHCCLTFFLIPSFRLFVRVAFKKITRTKAIQRKVLIVGADNTGLDVYERYIKNQNYGYALTGFIDDTHRPSLNGSYLGKVSDLNNVLDKYELDDIIVTLPLSKEKEIEKIISVGEQGGKRVQIVTNYQRFGEGKMAVNYLGEHSMITLRSLPLDIIDNKFYKRIFDIVFSVLVCVFILSWLIPIISLLIKLSSKGPVFFKQERWGLNNRTIVCYKFRSMNACSKDVDSKGNYQQARRDDPRITPIGKFLRKSNLDELPQFFNVLLGSMSVVGPRPHPVPLNEQSKDSVERYMMRHWVKPGITGWAQVNGYRGETKRPHLMKKRIEHDIWYIENWTFWLDLQVILQTLVNMVKGEKNAY